MSVLYANLISLLSVDIASSRILNERDSSILFGSSNLAQTTTFNIVATFSSISIVFVSNGILFGYHTLNWNFPKDDDPEFIAYKIRSDLELYFEKLSKK